MSYWRSKKQNQIVHLSWGSCIKHKKKSHRLKVKTWAWYIQLQSRTSASLKACCLVPIFSHMENTANEFPYYWLKRTWKNVLLKFISYKITIEGIIHCYKHPLVESFNVFFTECSAKKMSVFHVNSCAFLNQISITQAKVFLLCLG